MGKYGAIVLFSQIESNSVGQLDHSTVGRQLSQHIVGMNTKHVGNINEEPNKESDGETAMIHQEFLLDSTLSVKDYLEANGVTVMKFVRFECGETLPTDTDS